LNSSVNKETKALMCSVKLASYGPYSIYLEKEQIKHPYISWLLSTHYKKLEEEDVLSRLDDQSDLAGQIGEQRVEALVNILSSKL
jgi:sensor histidine kinase regulating citrate/malate metabolism